MRPRRPVTGALAAYLLSSLAATAALAGQATLPPPEFTAPLPGETTVSTDGTSKLSWRAGGDSPTGEPPGMRFELEEVAGQSGPLVIDAGAHPAAALSGRDDGVHRYRVRAVARDGATSPWSAAVEVRYEHHSLALALSLFATGAVVFVATAGLVLIGHHRAGSARS